MSDAFNLLANRLGSQSTAWHQFSAWWNQCERQNLDGLLSYVDESDYSASDWVDALNAFDHWLAENGISQRPFSAMTGYVHCCTLMNAKQVALPSLKDLVVQSLEEFGFEATGNYQG